jgi:hypothetical protein
MKLSTSKKEIKHAINNVKKKNSIGALKVIGVEVNWL